MLRETHCSPRISRGRPRIYTEEAGGFWEEKPPHTHTPTVTHTPHDFSRKTLDLYRRSRRILSGKAPTHTPTVTHTPQDFSRKSPLLPTHPHTPTPYDFSRKSSDLCRESLRNFKGKARISLGKVGAGRHPGWKARLFPGNAGQWSGPFISIPISCRFFRSSR